MNPAELGSAWLDLRFLQAKPTLTGSVRRAPLWNAVSRSAAERTLKKPD
jgi:hypothetical protein